MKLKQITVEQLATDTGKFLTQAKRTPLVIRTGKGPAIVIRAMNEDDLVDALITANPRFRRSIRRGRRNRIAGKGIPIEKVRQMLDQDSD